jgi:hypothetical protein
MDEVSDLFLQGGLLHALYPDRVQVDVPGENGQIRVFVYENALVPAMVEVAYAPLASVIVAGVGDIEMAHELTEIAKGSLKEKVKVVGHENVAGELDGVDIEGLGEDLEEALAVGVVFEDVFLFIAPAGHVVNRAGILDAERSCHALL